MKLLISAILVIFLTMGCYANDMLISSNSFENNQQMPNKYGCKYENVNPELDIKDIPSNAKSLALIVDDPDAPSGDWVHWIAWNIPVMNKIEENSVPGVEGLNDFQKNNYMGPCPPSGTHRYFFKLYALDTTLDLDENTAKQDLLNAMKGHILAQAALIGLFSK